MVILFGVRNYLKLAIYKPNMPHLHEYLNALRYSPKGLARGVGWLSKRLRIYQASDVGGLVHTDLILKNLFCARELLGGA